MKIKKICENCNAEFQIRFKTRNQKFCNLKCYKQDKLKGIKRQTKDKLSEALKKHYKDHPQKIMRGQQHSKNVGKGTIGKYKRNPVSILDVSSRTATKILKRMRIGCSRCNWSQATCDIHHINGKKVQDADGHWNLTYVCPNCHRMIHCRMIKKQQLISFKQYVKDQWLKHYYG